jgi:hypothetical protein
MKSRVFLEKQKEQMEKINGGLNSAKEKTGR